MIIYCLRRGFQVIYRHQNKKISQILLIKPMGFGLKNSENGPVSIPEKSKTNNGSTVTRRKDCNGEKIPRCHIWYLT